MTDPHPLAHLNAPDFSEFGPSDPRAWIGKPAKFREVHHSPPIEQVPYFALSTQPPPPVPTAVPRDEWVSARLAELRAPVVAKLRTATSAAADFDRKLQIAKKNYAADPSRETRQERDAALELLDGAQTDLEIVQAQIVKADAEHAAIDFEAKYEGYLQFIAAKQQYADTLARAEDAAAAFAQVVADLGVMRLGEIDGRRRVRDMLVRGFQRHGFHYEDLLSLVRV
jgi:hypothetical protein